MAYDYGMKTLPSGCNEWVANREHGWSFTVNEEIRVAGLRVYLPDTQTVTASLWSLDSNTALGQVSLTSARNTWCEGLFNGSVLLEAGKKYIISCYTANCYYTSSARSATYDPRISYETGRRGSTQGVKPTGTENNYTYPLIDIVIQRPAYKANGTAVFTVAGYVVGGDDSLYWTSNTPEGTSVAVSTSVNNSAWRSISNGGTMQDMPAKGQACNLRIKFELATTDEEQTPILSAISILSAEDRKTLILTPTMPSDLRGAVGNVSISYDGLGGLAGTGGPSAAFVGTFTPSGMTYRPNPYVEEHVEVSASANVVLTAITYADTQETEHIEVAVTATVKLTDIHDL